MSRKIVVALLILCVVATAVYCATSKKVVVEAEKYKNIYASMAKVTDANASKGAAIAIPLARPHAQTEGAPSDQGRATYAVSIPTKATYQLWARTWWYDGCGNSFFVKIGNKPAVVLGQDGTYQRWHWVKGPLVQLEAGTVAIIVQNREDGAKMDQFMLTRDLKYVPVRAEK